MDLALNNIRLHHGHLRKHMVDTEDGCKDKLQGDSLL